MDGYFKTTKYGVTNTTVLGNIAAPGGKINLTSVSSPGEVKIGTNESTTLSFESMGDIILHDNSLIDVSGEGAGDIFIQGGRLIANNSGIRADTKGDEDGGTISIEVESKPLIFSIPRF